MAVGVMMCKVLIIMKEVLGPNHGSKSRKDDQHFCQLQGGTAAIVSFASSGWKSLVSSMEVASLHHDGYLVGKFVFATVVDGRDAQYSRAGTRDEMPQNRGFFSRLT